MNIMNVKDENITMSYTTHIFDHIDLIYNENFDIADSYDCQKLNFEKKVQQTHPQKLNHEQ